MKEVIQAKFVAGSSRQSLWLEFSYVTMWSLLGGCVLLKESIGAEFVAGVLICNNVVAVRRVSLIEGGHPGKVCGWSCHM